MLDGFLTAIVRGSRTIMPNASPEGHHRLAIVDPLRGFGDFWKTVPLHRARSSAQTVFRINPAVQYHDRQFKLSAVDALFVYSDGVTEAMNPTDELFGSDRLGATLTAPRESGVDALQSDLRRSASSRSYLPGRRCATCPSDLPRPSRSRSRTPPRRPTTG